MIGKEPYLRGVWECFVQERSRVKRFRELADAEKQARNTRSVAAGIASQRVLGASEMLPGHGFCNEPMMKKGFNALKNENWEECKETFRKKMKSIGTGL